MKIYASHLNISFNRLNKIEKSAFKNLNSLVQLDLSYNNLDTLADIFERVFSLNSLDLRFNFIKIFENQFNFQLINLNIESNVLKFIREISLNLSIIENMTALDMSSNELTLIENEKFFDLPNLKRLNLNKNKFRFLKAIALKYASTLELIDLSDNLIEYINGNDFNFSRHLKSINLNNNLIKFIHLLAFVRLSKLDTFRISNNKMSNFNMSLLKSCQNIFELDLSFNKISFDSNIKWDIISNIQIVRLEKINFGLNFQFEMFLNDNIQKLDFSENDLNGKFNLLDRSINLEKLELRAINLSSMKQIMFRNLKKLTHLDLSHNNLSFLDYESFENLKKLEYLDLGGNKIYFIDGKIFSNRNDSTLKQLKYLSLVSNQIASFADSFINYCSIHTFKMSNNFLKYVPEFQVIFNGQVSLYATEFYFNSNKIKTLSYMSIYISSLNILNFDLNDIYIIEQDAFLNLMNLKNLSIAYNNLTRISTNNFAYQFNLKYLNLSHNQIDFIELDSFQNLENLHALDLSFNSLILIANNQFKGLINLSDLYLMSRTILELTNESLCHLTNTNNIYANESLIIKNKCLFMHSIERPIQRDVSNGKLLFYKSLNLISTEHLATSNLAYFCELTFHFLQFNVHFNLKTDYDNDLFYERCKYILQNKTNSYFNNCMKCGTVLKPIDTSEIIDITLEKKTTLARVLSNFIFIFICMLLLIFFTPVMCIIVSELFDRV